MPQPLIGITADMDKEHLKLKKEYVRAVTDAGGLPFILAPTLLNVTGYVEGIADAIDGLLLTGGDDIPPEYYGEALSVPPDILKPIEKERVDFEISLFKEMMKRQKPILGICYGMQMVNVALGGSLHQDIGIQVKGAQNHKEGKHKIKIVKPLAFSPQPSAFTVNSSHHQAVKNLGRGLEVFAMSDDGVIEGFYKPVPAGLPSNASIRGSKQGTDYPFLVCVQWHPERDMGKDGISASLFRLFVESSKKMI